MSDKYWLGNSIFEQFMKSKSNTPPLNYLLYDEFSNWCKDSFPTTNIPSYRSFLNKMQDIKSENNKINDFVFVPFGHLHRELTTGFIISSNSIGSLEGLLVLGTSSDGVNILKMSEKDCGIAKSMGLRINDDLPVHNKNNNILNSIIESLNISDSNKEAFILGFGAGIGYSFSK